MPQNSVNMQLSQEGIPSDYGKWGRSIYSNPYLFRLAWRSKGRIIVKYYFITAHNPGMGL